MLKKMSNEKIVATVNAIKAMQDREVDSKEKLFGSKIKVIYAIKKNKETLSNLLKPYEEALKELIDECCDKEKSTDGQIAVRLDCLQKFNDSLSELLKIEVDVEIHTVKIEDLDGLSLSMTDMDAIDFMIEE